MPVTSNSNGVSLYHYSKRLVEEGKDASLINKEKPMNRYERRKLERRIKKKVNKYFK